MGRYLAAISRHHVRRRRGVQVSAPEPVLVRCTNGHVLKQSQRATSWGCDARRELGGCLCKGGITGQQRWRCEGCDFGEGPAMVPCDGTLPWYPAMVPCHGTL